MKKSHVVTAVLAVTLFLAACGGSTPTPTTVPQPFTSAEGGFLVMSPAPLTETTEVVKIEIGSLEMHTFQGENSGFSYLVVYSDYPQGLKTADAAGLLASARDDQVNSLKGKLVSETQVMLSGVQGREIRISAQGEDGQNVVVRGRLYWVPTRLYRVLVIAAPERVDEASVSSFLESFKLTDRAY
jgi:hypothetical protein